ncbi:hypothetical protein GCM10009610_71480 [Pseudonocardia xinjiangensis]
MAFIDAHRDAVVEGHPLGVEPICRVLQVAPSTYYAAKARPPSRRARRDAELGLVLVGLWEDNYRVYGARKLWKAARRAGLEVGRDQVARLMRVAGIEGARRTKRVRTTRADPVAARHPDLVERQFRADGPNQLWVLASPGLSNTAPCSTFCSTRTSQCPARHTLDRRGHCRSSPSCARRIGQLHHSSDNSSRYRARPRRPGRGPAGCSLTSGA